MNLVDSKAILRFTRFTSQKRLSESMQAEPLRQKFPVEIDVHSCLNAFQNSGRVELPFEWKGHAFLNVCCHPKAGGEASWFRFPNIF